MLRNDKGIFNPLLYQLSTWAIQTNCANCTWSQPYEFTRDANGVASSVVKVQLPGRWVFDRIELCNDLIKYQNCVCEQALYKGAYQA